MHDHLDAGRERGGAGRGSGGSFRSATGTPRRAPTAAGGGAVDAQAHVARFKAFTRTEALAALRLTIRSGGRDPEQFGLHLGRIGGGNSARGARGAGTANPTRR